MLTFRFVTNAFAFLLLSTSCAAYDEEKISSVDKNLQPQLSALVRTQPKYSKFSPTLDSKNAENICFGYLGCFPPVKPIEKENTTAIYPFDPDRLNVTFKIYTSKNFAVKLDFNPTKVDFLKMQFNGTKPTKVIIHGFLESLNASNWMYELKDIIFKAYPGRYNVILVDWSTPAFTPQTFTYSQAAANAHVIGAMIANFMKELEIIQKAIMLHFIGHGLGAQIAGIAGFKSRSQSIGRITGLDPAGPMFEGEAAHLRLDAFDALYVDTLHTDVGLKGFGSDRASNNDDFYPNGGEHQPGCEVTKIDLTTFTPKDISDAKICSHRRSWQMFFSNLEEREEPCQFIGYRCWSHNDFKSGRCADCGEKSEQCSLLNIWGEEDRNTGNEFQRQINQHIVNYDRRLYFDTSSTPPYCLYHYQLKINLNANSEKFEGRLRADLYGSLRNELNYELASEINIYQNGAKYFLLKFNTSLGKVNKIVLKSKKLRNFLTEAFSFLSSEPELKTDSIELKYMSNINETIRQNLSSHLCEKRRTLSKNEWSYVHEYC